MVGYGSQANTLRGDPVITRSATKEEKEVMTRVKKRKGVRKTISAGGGTAYYLHTEVEGPRGGWDDHWKTSNGYWVIHRGNEHHVYSTNERHKPRRKKRRKK